MKWLIAIVALVIGLGLGWWLGVSHGKATAPAPGTGPTTSRLIHMVVDPFGNVAVAPAVGDVIDWRNYDGTPFTVTLASYGVGNDLCQQGSTVQTCNVVSSSGWYPYTCNGVTCDPVIAPGSNIKTFHPNPIPPKPIPPTRAFAPAASANGGEYALVSCENKVSTITGYQTESGTLNGNAVSPGDVIFWSAGGPGTVTVDPKTCTSGASTITINSEACTIASNWTTPQTYKLNLTGCGEGTATLILQSRSAARSKR